MNKGISSSFNTSLNRNILSISPCIGLLEVAPPSDPALNGSVPLELVTGGTIAVGPLTNFPSTYNLPDLPSYEPAIWCHSLKEIEDGEFINWEVEPSCVPKVGVNVPPLALAYNKYKV